MRERRGHALEDANHGAASGEQSEGSTQARAGSVEVRGKRGGERGGERGPRSWAHGAAENRGNANDRSPGDAQVSAGRDLAFLPAAELHALVAAREVSAEEVVSAALERIGRHNGRVNAVVTLSPRALEEARAIDRRLARGEDAGPLAGVPVGIKDMTPVAGLRTTYGCRLYADHVPEEDALVVRRLRAAGAVVVGKTNTPEFAAGANTFNDVFGATRNPWDPALSAGGSTGGGAAGLATGMFALAEGTDLGGSLRIPAAFCGVTGLRPSPGLVPTEPTDWAWDTIMVTGLMARSAEDLALGLQAVAGPSAGSPLRQPVAGRDFPAAAPGGDGTRRPRRLVRGPGGDGGGSGGGGGVPGGGVRAGSGGRRGGGDRPGSVPRPQRLPGPARPAGWSPTTRTAWTASASWAPTWRATSARDSRPRPGSWGAPTGSGANSGIASPTFGATSTTC